MRRTWTILSVVLTVACGGTATDTGWIGTWVRGDADRTQSAISIWLEDGRYRFAVRRTSANGSARLECDRDGRCLEYAGDAPYYEYRYEVVEADDAALVVETRGRPIEGGRGQPMTMRERFEREAHGRALRRYRVAVNDRPLPPSDRFVRFEKRSDAPFHE